MCLLFYLSVFKDEFIAVGHSLSLTCRIVTRICIFVREGKFGLQYCQIQDSYVYRFLPIRAFHCV